MPRSSPRLLGGRGRVRLKGRAWQRVRVDEPLPAGLGRGEFAAPHHPPYGFGMAAQQPRHFFDGHVAVGQVSPFASFRVAPTSRAAPSQEEMGRPGLAEGVRGRSSEPRVVVGRCRPPSGNEKAVTRDPGDVPGIIAGGCEREAWRARCAVEVFVCPTPHDTHAERTRTRVTRVQARQDARTSSVAQSERTLLGHHWRPPRAVGKPSALSLRAISP